MGGGSPDPSSSFISTHSEDSMVEIVQHPPPESPGPYRLLYSKSKVYVHPSAFTRDNVPGFVGIVKKEGLHPTYYLTWIPESLLDQRGHQEWDKFVNIENSPRPTPTDHDEEDGVLIDPPPKGQSYAFSVPVTSMYSLMVTAPTMSSWYGSLTANLINGSTLSTLHFHDDESRSMQGARSNTTTASWGGEDLMQKLRLYCHLLKSSIQPHLFLVDPSKADIETHTTIIFDDLDFTLSSSPVPIHRRPHRPNSPNSIDPNSPRISVLHETMSQPSSARMSILSGFSQFTKATRHAAQNILSHPLAKPIIPHLPEPVRSLVNVQGEWTSWVEKGGVGEYESARVYLAKWARVIAEEGERARQRDAHRIASERNEERSDLGVFELLAETSSLPAPKPTRNPKLPIDSRAWNSWFDRDGQPNITIEEMKKEVFQRGLVHEIKRQAWPFILGVMPWNSTTSEREKLWEDRRIQYEAFKAEWCGVDEVFNSSSIIEERHRIDVDCRRTDRTHPLFAFPEPSSASTHNMASSSIAVNEVQGAHTAANDHVDTLSVILLTYHFYEKDLGYVQGMSDLLSPIYVICGGNEVESFWCFVRVMERMKQNFLRDQSGMHKQLLTLQQLLQVMDPELYRHFDDKSALNLFFCFRWILIHFKREFPFEDVIQLWECLWTDYYTNQFVLFVALAVLESHRDVILRYLVEFDEILKYCNELSMTIEVDSTLAQAEVLFVSFAQIVADIDKRQAEYDAARGNQPYEIRRRRRSGGTVVNGRPITLPTISDNLRELLQNKRGETRV